MTMNRRRFIQVGAGALAGLWLPGCKQREPGEVSSAKVASTEETTANEYL